MLRPPPPKNWRIAYPVFLGAMALIGLANFLALRWLDSRDKPDDVLYGYPSASETEEDEEDARPASDD